MANKKKVKVHFLDNRWMQFEIDAAVRIGELREIVSKKLKLAKRHAWCFEFFVLFSERRMLIAHEMRVFDISCHLVYAIYRLTEALARIRHRKNILRLLYADCVYRIITGEYYCSKDQAPLLAALQLSILGATSSARDNADVSQLIKDHIKELIPWPLLTSSKAMIESSSQSQYWERAILNAFQNQFNHNDADKDTENENADVQRARYIDLVQSSNCYGVELFQCTQLALIQVSGSTLSTNAALPQPIAELSTVARAAIAICNKGLYLLLLKFPTASDKNLSSKCPGFHFFHPSLTSAFFFQLAELEKWGHDQTDTEFYVQIPLATKSAVLDLLAPVAIMKKKRRHTSFFTKNESHSLLLYCIFDRDASACASLLNDFALAQMQENENTHRKAHADTSTTDEDDESNDQQPKQVRTASNTFTLKANELSSLSKKSKLRGDATTSIASRWRGARLRMEWQRQNATIAIQSRWRSVLCRMHLEREVASVFIQCIVRGYLKRRHQKKRQYIKRGRVFRYSKLITLPLVPRPPPRNKPRSAWVSIIQCHWRGHKVRRDLRYLNSQLAAIQIQAHVRGLLLRNEI